MSRVTIRIPTPLRSFTDGSAEVSGEGETVGEVLATVFDHHRDLEGQLVDANGDLRQFVNLYLDGTNVRSLAGLDSPVGDGSTLHVVPAVAGGRR